MASAGSRAEYVPVNNRMLEIFNTKIANHVSRVIHIINRAPEHPKLHLKWSSSSNDLWNFFLSRQYSIKHYTSNMIFYNSTLNVFKPWG